MRALSFFLTFALAGAAWAECPPAPDHSAEFAGLVAEVRAAPNEMAARQISGRMWELWADAPDELAQEVLDRGMSARSSYDFLAALDAFNKLVEYCPHYAEGYNQRAFVNFLRHDFATALGDLNRALELSPDHIAARAGLALTLLGLGRIDEARSELEAALALNPWLSERHLMSKGQPLAPAGEDI